MGGLVKQPSRLFNLKLVRKHFPEGITAPKTSSSSKQNTKPKGRGSTGSNAAQPGLVEDPTESEGSPNEDYQKTSDDIWDMFWKPGPGETAEDVRAFLAKKQYPAMLSPAELGTLEQPSPPPTKPLPQIPAHARPHTAPQRVTPREGDRQLPPWTPQTTRPQVRKMGATYSPFPKLNNAFPPRTTSITPSWQSTRDMQKPQRPPRPDVTATQQAHRHIAKHYHDMSKQREKTPEELREDAYQDLLQQVTKAPRTQSAITGSCRRDFIRPLDEVIMSTRVEVAEPSPQSPQYSALFMPPVEDDWDEFTPILSRPPSPKHYRSAVSLEHSPQIALQSSRPTTAVQESCHEAITRDHRPATASQDASLEHKHTTGDRRPTRPSLETCHMATSLDSHATASPESFVKTTHDERPIPVHSPATRSATNLPLPDVEPRPMVPKKSVPNLRPVPRHRQPLPPLPPLPLSISPSKFAALDVPSRSCFDEDTDVEDNGRFGFLRLNHSRNRSSKNKESSNKSRRSDGSTSPPSSPSSPRLIFGFVMAHLK